jgi:hypothetical protein
LKSIAAFVPSHASCPCHLFRIVDHEAAGVPTRLLVRREKLSLHSNLGNR